MTGDPPVEQPVPEERPERWADLAAPAPLLALSWSLAQIAFVIWPTINTLVQRGLHVSFACALAFALIARTASSTGGKWLNWLLAALAMVPGIYISIQSDFLMSERIVGLDPVQTLDYVFGFGIIGLLFIAAWRTLGPGLALFAAFFVLYFFVGPYLPGVLSHRYTGVERFIDSQYLSFDGLYGVPTGVSVSTVFYFVLFAAIYDVFGGGRLIIDLALVVTGQRVGGPAKAAVVASGLLGSVSGSAVANVMSTGIFTIPLMRRGGYTPQFAGGVEAAASTGAQLVPPVMGAAAFIMADFLRVPYQTIVLAAIIPAIVYYIALLLMVHLEARRRGAAAVAAATEPIRDVLLARGHLLLPLVWLAYRIVIGFPVEVAAIEASAATIVMGMLRKSTRQSLRGLVEALVLAAERSVTVAVPCALAGVVVAVISYTGLGTKFTSLMILLAAGQVGVLLVLTMFASLVLGAGMPTTSAYIMAAVLLAPSLTLVGVEPLVAHFFIFYFAILSMVTPPVALSAYAAAAITGASSSATAWQALLLSLPGFVIPFAAVMHPGLLLLGTPMDTVWGVINVLLGFFGIGVAVIGWLSRRLWWWERLAFAAIGLLNVLPGLWVTMASFALLLIAVVWVRWHAVAPPGSGKAGGDGPSAARPGGRNG